MCGGGGEIERVIQAGNSFDSITPNERAFALICCIGARGGGYMLPALSVHTEKY